MSFELREWFHRLLGTLKQRDSETDEELRFHLAMAEEEALRRGQSVREARLRVGGVAQAADAIRDQSVVGWLADFLRDSRHGIRLLKKSPLFTAAAIVSLALGIGANTAIFSLIDTVILRMMPVHEPERLVQFWTGPFLSAVSPVRQGTPLFHGHVRTILADGTPGRHLQRGTRDG